MVGSFLIGVLVGAGAMWLYGRDIVMYVDDKTREARARVAETLQSAADTLQPPRQSPKASSEDLIGGERRVI